MEYNKNLAEMISDRIIEWFLNLKFLYFLCDFSKIFHENLRKSHEKYKWFIWHFNIGIYFFYNRSFFFLRKIFNMRDSRVNFQKNEFRVCTRLHMTLNSRVNHAWIEWIELNSPVFFLVKHCSFWRFISLYAFGQVNLLFKK